MCVIHTIYILGLTSLQRIANMYGYNDDIAVSDVILCWFGVVKCLCGKKEDSHFIRLSHSVLMVKICRL